MAGSEAEERIRAKVEAQMRLWYPAGRIIHELVLEQGGRRLDVATVTEDRIVVAEIKSEKDTLKRLKAQVERALQVADEVWVVVAEKHAAEVRSRLSWSLPRASDEERWTKNPDYMRDLEKCVIFTETDAGLKRWKEGGAKFAPLPYHRFDLLWAAEMRNALGRHFGGAAMTKAARMTRDDMARLIIEHLSGREIRRAVCAQLRARGFARADEGVADAAS